MSEGRMERETNRQSGAVSAVMWTRHRSVMVFVNFQINSGQSSAVVWLICSCVGRCMILTQLTVTADSKSKDRRS